MPLFGHQIFQGFPGFPLFPPFIESLLLGKGKVMTKGRPIFCNGLAEYANMPIPVSQSKTLTPKYAAG
jgi:hypothetical protein